MLYALRAEGTKVCLARNVVQEYDDPIICNVQITVRYPPTTRYSGSCKSTGGQ
jgi:hypothetical protein